jgi:hypothetical protein
MITETITSGTPAEGISRDKHTIPAIMQRNEKRFTRAKHRV